MDLKQRCEKLLRDLYDNPKIEMDKEEFRLLTDFRAEILRDAATLFEDRTDLDISQSGARGRIVDSIALRVNAKGEEK